MRSNIVSHKLTHTKFIKYYSYKKIKDRGDFDILIKTRSQERQEVFVKSH